MLPFRQVINAINISHIADKKQARFFSRKSVLNFSSENFRSDIFAGLNFNCSDSFYSVNSTFHDERFGLFFDAGKTLQLKTDFRLKRPIPG